MLGEVRSWYLLHKFSVVSDGGSTDSPGSHRAFRISDMPSRGEWQSGVKSCCEGAGLLKNRLDLRGRSHAKSSKCVHWGEPLKILLEFFNEF